jgi:Icc-related predicted phosphoesterase
MRLLLVSDLHYRLRQFDWLSAAAGDSALALDLVCIAGDLLDIRSAVPIEAQEVAVSAHLRTLGERIPLLVASGNHDLDGRDSAGEKAAGWLSRLRLPRVYVDSDSLMVGDTLFTVCPWWDGPIGQKALDERLEAEAARPKRRWVWAYHSPPSGSALSWDGRKEYGDSVLTEWLPRFKPDVVLTGHIHQAPFADHGGWADRIGPTWLFNPGQQHGDVPEHVVIDFADGSATWFSSTGLETVRLGD